MNGQIGDLGVLAVKVVPEAKPFALVHILAQYELKVSQKSVGKTLGSHLGVNGQAARKLAVEVHNIGPELTCVE